jgi:hypothetical protein
MQRTALGPCAAPGGFGSRGEPSPADRSTVTVAEPTAARSKTEQSAVRRVVPIPFTAPEGDAHRNRHTVLATQNSTSRG